MKIQRHDMKLLGSHLLWLVCAAGARIGAVGLCAGDLVIRRRTSTTPRRQSGQPCDISARLRGNCGMSCFVGQTENFSERVHFVNVGRLSR